MSTLGKTNRKILQDVKDQLCGVSFAIEAGDSVLLINGKPSPRNCRVLAEESYQALLTAKDRLEQITTISEGRHGA